MHKVYLVTNLLNSVKYVGYTSKDINTRFEWHCTRKNCNKLYNAIKKYGRANFSVKELGVFGTKEEALRYEADMILEINTLHPLGYNLSTGGEAPNMVESVREKMSKAQKARPLRPPMKEEQKIKISKTRIARGLKPSKESILKGLETKKRNNKPLPKDFGKKISERQVGKNNPSARAVRCLNDGKLFNTIKEASDYYNTKPININAVLKGRNKSTGKDKLKFEYLNNK